MGAFNFPSFAAWEQSAARFGERRLLIKDATPDASKLKSGAIKDEGYPLRAR